MTTDDNTARRGAGAHEPGAIRTRDPGCPHRRFTGAPCGGTVQSTGYCDTCGRSRTDPGLPPLPTAPEKYGPAGLLELPPLEPSSPGQRLDAATSQARILMRCSAKSCPTFFIAPNTAVPPPDTGYCPQCGAPYAYRPELSEDGPLLQDQYRIRGPIAHGGQGWVYLAEDTHLEEYVAVKGSSTATRNGAPPRPTRSAAASSPSGTNASSASGTSSAPAATTAPCPAATS